jgi:hypothetical protein
MSQEPDRPAQAPGALADGGGAIEFGNEFTRVVVELIRTRNGARLRICVPASGRQVSLCPLELESLTWQEPEFFSRLLATPFGPEPAADPGAGDS